LDWQVATAVEFVVMVTGGDVMIPGDAAIWCVVG
jgi:hypothetical protein